jgi:hypothetical protein
VRLVGFHDLAARSAYQPTIKRQGDRWIAYVGSHGGCSVNPLNAQLEEDGTSILEVTDRRAPWRGTSAATSMPWTAPTAGSTCWS